MNDLEYDRRKRLAAMEIAGIIAATRLANGDRLKDVTAEIAYDARDLVDAVESAFEDRD
jgi:hypothetical protein